MKRILLTIAVTALFAYYLMTHFSAVQNIYNVAGHITFAYLAAAFLLSVVGYLFIGRASRSVFHLMGLDKGLTEMIRLQFTAVAINVLVPTAGASIMLLYAEEAKKNKESSAIAAASYLVWVLASYTALAVLLFFATLYLVLTGKLTAFFYIPALLFLALLVGFLLLFRLSQKSPHQLRAIFVWIKSVYVKFMAIFKKRVSPTGGVDDIILEIQDAAGKIRSNYTSFSVAVFEILASHLFYLVSAEVLFLSFGYHPLYRVLLAGYAAGALFTIVSPTPNGVGFAEVGMAAVFASLGVNTQLAGIVAILSRALSYWLPMFIGFVLLQQDNLKRITHEVTS